eukprot:CAMPEP_0174956208 /NCGR_PEP_ID=MMETSP0004_2-20121128/1402_1 /TAXON_ID=420556 /ORGANISM="Ochromonas sp., Strain CCMP1393" /LENGTH=47 /DNA_ID= /DNA_START= /DNA_END= /DNA_ORIENTATION=
MLVCPTGRVRMHITTREPEQELHGGPTSWVTSPSENGVHKIPQESTR